MTGTDIPTYTREAIGMSAFALSDDVLYHTYSTYARGIDALWGMNQWLDRAPKVPAAGRVYMRFSIEDVTSYRLLWKFPEAAYSGGM
jgi:predicted dithiol-disulfide oxidoreductase (DUF899 family)